MLTANRIQEGFKTIQPEMKRLDEMLLSEARSQEGILGEVTDYIVKAGGKRLRPAMAFMLARALGEVQEEHLYLAEAIELLHIASLIHDDVIDGSSLRRGQPTVNVRWSEKVSVIAGDFLFATSSSRIADIRDHRITKIIANVLSEMCRGEIEQMRYLYSPEISMEGYLTKSFQKTAVLMEGTCLSSAIISGADEAVVQAMGRYGKYLGLAFQIADDILDYVGTEKELGKAAGNDLKEGYVTAPAIYALQGAKGKDELRALISARFTENGKSLATALEIVRSSSSISQAKGLAKEYAQKAADQLVHLPSSPIREFLEALCYYTVERHF